MTRQEAIDQALGYFDQGYACSQSILLAFSGKYKLDTDIAKRISSTFGGGMGRLRQKCGALTGAYMVLGLEFGNTLPDDMQTKLEAYRKVRVITGSVEDIYGTSNCAELLKKHATEAEVSQRKHHKIICRAVIGDVAGLLYDMIEGTTTEQLPAK